VVLAGNPNTWEAEAGRLRIQGQLGVYSKISQRKIFKNLKT
jgi:hypothetical protein